jgi:hypothetical protein
MEARRKRKFDENDPSWNCATSPQVPWEERWTVRGDGTLRLWGSGDRMKRFAKCIAISLIFSLCVCGQTANESKSEALTKDAKILTNKILLALYPLLNVARYKVNVRLASFRDDESEYRFSALLDERDVPERKTHSEEDEFLHLVVKVKNHTPVAVFSEGRYVSSVELGKLRDEFAVKKLKPGVIAKELRLEGAEFAPPNKPSMARVNRGLRTIFGAKSFTPAQFKYFYHAEDPALLWESTAKLMSSDKSLYSVTLLVEPIHGRVSSIQIEPMDGSESAFGASPASKLLALSCDTGHPRSGCLPVLARNRLGPCR